MIKKYSRPSQKRAVRIRSKIRQLAGRPRLSVFRSLKYIYAQIIDDTQGVTLVAARGQKAAAVGTELAKKAQLKKIIEVVFDRGSYRYLGQVRQLAEAARQGGLKF